MKKTLLLLLFLLMASSITFAEGPSWSIWGRSELRLLYGNTDSDDIMAVWGTDWWSNDYNDGGPHMGFNISFSNDTFGYDLGFQWQNWDIFGDKENVTSDGNGAKIFNCYGTARAIPDLLELKIGLISEGGYNYNPPAAPDWDGKKNGDIWAKPGLMVTVTPPDTNLKVMAFYHTPLDPNLAFPVDWSVGPNTGVNGDTVENCLLTSDLCLKYTIPQIATITAGTLGIQNQAGWKADNGRPVFLTTSLSMIQNLTLDLSFQYNLASTLDEDDSDGVDDTDSFSGILGVTYNMGPLSLKAAGWIFDYLAEEAQISYRAGLNIEYTMGDFWLALQNIYTYNYGLDDMGDQTTLGVLEIYPMVKYNPSGVQLGFGIMHNLETELLQWWIPIQVDFSF